MKKIYVFFSVLLVILVVCLFSTETQACAMCKETGTQSEGFSSRGLNSGILYLMAIPYVAFAALGYFWYKASKKQKEHDLKVAEALKGKIE